MSNTFKFPVTSRPDTNFTEALAAAASYLTGPFAATPINTIYGVEPINSKRYLLVGISIEAVEQLGLQFLFYSSAAGGFLCSWNTASMSTWQKDGSGLYNYYQDGFSMPIYDADTINTVNPPNLHVAVQNIDTVAKSADAAGALTVTFWLTPMQGW